MAAPISRGGDRGAAVGAHQVGGAHAVGQHLLDRLFDARRLVAQIEGIAQRHREAAGCRRSGWPCPARDVGGRAVHGFVQRLRPAVRHRRAKAGRGQHAQRRRSASRRNPTARRRTGCRSRSRRTAWASGTSCIAPLSAYMCDSSTSGYSLSCTSCTTSRHRMPDSITLAFSIEQTLLLRLRASSKADRATRAISLFGVALGVDADALVAFLEDAARFAEIDAARSVRARSRCRGRRRPRSSATRNRPARRSTAPGAGWKTGPSPCAAAAGRARASR